MNNNNQLQRRTSSRNRPLTMQQMESQLEPLQVKAARMLIDNEFADKDGKKSLGDIADELEITPRTLYNWRQIPMFAAYQNALADYESYSFAPVALAQLQNAIKGTSNNGMTSIKALELWFKVQGRLVDRKEIHSQIEQTTRTISREEVSEGLAGLDRFIDIDYEEKN